MKHFSAFVALDLGLGLGFVVLAAGGIRGAQTPDRPPNPPRVAALILDIHREVKELGPYPGEDFVRREFFLGEDDDDTNKDIHAVIIIQAMDGADRMRIQVTIMERSGNDPKIKYARGTKSFVCRVSPAGEAALLTSDYTTQELEPVLRALKRAVLDKKRLLRER